MNLELQVVDNFLPEKLFKKLKTCSVTLDYSSKKVHSQKIEENTHVFLSNSISKNDELIEDIDKCLKKHFGIKIKNFHLAAFTCVNTKRATPHKDVQAFPNEKHLIIYLNGDPKLNAGTGFYNFINEKTFDLNTAVGCFPNRAVLFNAEDWHSPLLYTAKDNLPRFSIIVWFEPENNL